ncbi:hypothetical protein ZWY2020_037897 [Hordeum vulgare]|nr:hypothetical protein ZWY2020_037897 [Hordeum vulgare]
MLMLVWSFLAMNTALPVGVSLVVRVLHVVELERQLEVEQQHDVEALQWLRPHTEPDGQQVSEDADLAVVGIEDFGALLLQEEPGLDVGLEEVLAGQVVDTDVEVLSHVALAPGDRDDTGPALPALLEDDDDVEALPHEALAPGDRDEARPALPELLEVDVASMI